MKNVKALADKLGVVPKLRLGEKIEGGGVESTGPHRVTFTAEPTFIKGKDFQGKEQEQMKFLVEENGEKRSWTVAIKGKNGEPTYLFPHLMDIEVGDERVLEMKRHGAQNHIEVRKVDEPSSTTSKELEDIGDGIEV